MTDLTLTVKGPTEFCYGCAQCHATISGDRPFASCVTEGHSILVAYFCSRRCLFAYFAQPPTVAASLHP